MLGDLPYWPAFPQPIGLWVMNERAGTIFNDLSGNGNNGIITDLSGGGGWVGDSLYLLTTDDADVGPRTDRAYNTYVIWIKSADWGAARYAYHKANIVRLGSTDGANVRAYQYAGTGGLNYVTSTGHNCSDGKWHQYAHTWDGTDLKLYIDGVYINSVSTNPGTGDINTGANLPLCPDVTNNQLYYKTFSIYDKVLTAQQIAYLYRNPFPWFEEDEGSHLYVPAAGGISMPLLMQQMNHFNGGMAA